MAYLGNSPVLSQQEYRNIDNISGSFNGVTTSFALLVNGVAPVPAPQSSNQCLISVNGVVQKPDDTGASGFRISGGNIIFSSAPTGGQSFFGVILAGADYIYAGENFPDGTVSAPSITFAQDLDTGFFRSGAGEIKYTANGTAVVTLSSNNLTAPSFIPTSSSAPTNGVYLPAANTVGISTNGTRRFQASSDGTINVFGANKTPSGGGNSVVYATDTQAVDVGGSIAFGGYYIGTSSDTEWAQIAGRKENSTSGNYAGYLQFSTRANGGSTTERLRITSAGLVGIGTTSPGNLLTVSTNTDGTTSLLKLHADADGVNNGLAGIKLSGNAGDHAAYIYGGHSTSGNTFLSFYTDLYAGSHNPQEKMRLDANGRLLLGTSSANGNYTLQIQGDAAASTAFGSIYLRRGLNTASIGANVGAGLGQIVFGANDGTTAALIECTSDATWSSTSDTPGRLVFSTCPDGSASPVERMRIDNTGNVVLKPTDPASVTNAYSTYLGFRVTQTNAQSALLGTIRGQGTSSWGGDLVFSTKPANGNPDDSVTERMRIRNDGVVFIPAAYGATTANAANLNVATDGALQRSTSSIKYKTSVETLQDQYADALLNVRPVWYRSICPADRPDYGFWGFIAEEVAEIDPRLVHWKTEEITYDEKGSAVMVPCEPEPEGVQYDRFVPHLLNLIKRQQQAIENLQAEVAALKAQ